MVRACLVPVPRDERAQALQAFGLAVPADAMPRAAVIDVWPEHWLPLQLYQLLRTQWRMGVRMPIGLDYTAIDSPMVRAALRPWPRPRVLREALTVLREMEAHSLDIFGQQADEAARRPH